MSVVISHKLQCEVCVMLDALLVLLKRERMWPQKGNAACMFGS